MGALPRSLTTAIRDLSVLAAVAFVLGGALDAVVTQFDRLDVVRASKWIALQDIPFSWGTVLREDGRWTGAVLVCAAACWCATRARHGRVARRVPMVVATLVVAARSAGAVMPGTLGIWFDDLWPGPSMPYRFTADSSIGLAAAHPAWGFPLLVVALLGAASLLGARAQTMPDDGASRRVATAPRSGLPLAAAVVGLPAVGATTAAVLAYLALDRSLDPNAVPDFDPRDLAGSVARLDHVFGPDAVTGLVGELVPILITVVAAAALLSGTGRLGAVVTGLVGLGTVAPAVSAWLPGTNDLVLALVGAIAVLCLTAALWRPCTTWGTEILRPLRGPAPLPVSAGGDGSHVPPDGPGAG